MPELSFGWTWPAFVARHKRVTRRGWTEDYAKQWRTGTAFTALDRQRRFGGEAIGRGRVIVPVRSESIGLMPNCDYALEGFAWMHKHPETIPASCPFGNCRFANFETWRWSGVALWVIRFEIVEVAAEARARLEELLSREAGPPPIPEDPDQRLFGFAGAPAPGEPERRAAVEAEIR
jgi:hypothetical protein